MIDRIQSIWEAWCDLFDGFCSFAGSALFETWHDDRH